MWIAVVHMQPKQCNNAPSIAIPRFLSLSPSPFPSSPTAATKDNVQHPHRFPGAEGMLPGQPEMQPRKFMALGECQTSWATWQQNQLKRSRGI